MTVLDDHASTPFQYKFKILRSDNYRKTIEYYVNWIYEQDDPCTLTGIVTCPDHDKRKVKFDDDWCIIYECKDDVPFFINFYLES